MSDIDRSASDLGGRLVLVPVCVGVGDLDEATRFYEKAIAATGEPDLELGGGVRARRVGSILLFAGPEPVLVEVRRLRAIVIVYDLAAAVEAAQGGGGVVVKEAVPVGAGRLSHVRHPDGSIFEYLAI